MKLALDTCAYSLCDLGRDDALAAVSGAAELFLPAVAYGELCYGFRWGKRFSQNMDRLTKFIRQFGVTVVPVGAEVAATYAELFANLRRKGTPIPTNDVWIAACAVSTGSALATADRHFAAIDGLRVEWLRDES